jgi:hypothetical protein
LGENGADAKPSAEQIAKWAVAFDMYTTAQMKVVVHNQRAKMKRTLTEMHAEKAAEKAAEEARFGAIVEEQRKLKVRLRVSCPACTRRLHSPLSLAAFTRPCRVLHDDTAQLRRTHRAATRCTA